VTQTRLTSTVDYYHSRCVAAAAKAAHDDSLKITAAIAVREVRPLHDTHPGARKE